MMDLDPRNLQALLAAVDEGTFDAAARRLHVTPSAVSQRIKALESALGRVLVVRSKPVRPTESGATLLRLARQIETLTGDALAEIGSESEATVAAVPLATNADSLATWLLPALTGLPDWITVDVRSTDQERTADLLRDGTVMAAVTSDSTPVPGCSVHRLGRMTYRPRASAAFVTRWFPDGASVAELERAAVVVYDRDDDLQDRYLRRRSRRILHPPRHFVPMSTAFVEAIRAGMGWGMVPDQQATDELIVIDGRSSADVTLYWQQWRLRSAALDRVAAAVREAARSLR